jgi:hypothetical protein
MLWGALYAWLHLLWPIGRVQLDSGETVNGFACELIAIADGKDTTGSAVGEGTAVSNSRIDDSIWCES